MNNKTLQDIRECLELSEGFNLNKDNRVDHCPHSAEFAKHYVKAHKGNYRSGGSHPNDEKHSDSFHSTYDSHSTRHGFAGSGTTVYTHKKTGEKFEVDRTPSGGSFYGTHHRVRKLQ